MATYNSGYIYNTGVIYNSSSPSPPSPSPQEDGTISISPQNKILSGPGTNLNGSFTYARVDTDTSSDSISETYDSDNISLANVDSPSTQVGTVSGGVTDQGGTDITMEQNTTTDPITINNAGSRFMR